MLLDCLFLYLHIKMIIHLRRRIELGSCVCRDFDEFSRKAHHVYIFFSGRVLERFSASLRLMFMRECDEKDHENATSFDLSNFVNILLTKG